MPAGEPRAIAGRRRPAPTDAPSVMTAEGSGSSSASAGSITIGRRLHTSDVPAITTHFLPRFQNRSQAYEPDTPLSTTSLHDRHDGFPMSINGEEAQRRRSYAAGPDTPLSSSSLHGHQPVPSMQREEPRGLIYGQQPGPPDTPLSAASLRSQHQDAFPIHHNNQPQPHTRARAHTQPDTPLSASSALSHEQHPYTSIRDGLHDRIDFPHSPGMLDDDRERAVGQGQEYWYSARTTASHSHGPSPIHPHPSSTDMNPSRLAVGSAPSSSFPMSEAFYEQLTASFSSAPDNNHHHPNSTPVNYPGQVHREYAGGSGRHRAPTTASVPSNHGLVPSPDTHPNLSSGARGVDAVSPPAVMDQDALVMWSAAPIGFEYVSSLFCQFDFSMQISRLDDWGSYLDTVNELTQARMHAGGTLQ